MKELNFDLPSTERQVVIIHILNDGQVLIGKKELEAFADRFTWVDKNKITNSVVDLRAQTESLRKSIIAIFESGEIRSYPNVSPNFTNYALLNKSGI